MNTITPDFLASLRQTLGDTAIDVSDDTIARYSRNLLPSGDRRPAGVVYPSSTAEVQTIVRLANRYRFPLYTISTGENRGLGLKSPIQPGCLIVDVGKRMNRILEIIVSRAIPRWQNGCRAYLLGSSHCAQADWSIVGCAVRIDHAEHELSLRLRYFHPLSLRVCSERP